MLRTSHVIAGVYFFLPRIILITLIFIRVNSCISGIN
jgi:hypothetical protein